MRDRRCNTTSDRCDRILRILRILTSTLIFFFTTFNLRKPQLHCADVKYNIMRHFKAIFDALPGTRLSCIATPLKRHAAGTSMRMLKAKISGTRLTVRISISQVATPGATCIRTSSRASRRKVFPSIGNELVINPQ